MPSGTPGELGALSTLRVGRGESVFALVLPFGHQTRPRPVVKVLLGRDLGLRACEGFLGRTIYH